MNKSGDLSRRERPLPGRQAPRGDACPPPQARSPTHSKSDGTTHAQKFHTCATNSPELRSEQRIVPKGHGSISYSMYLFSRKPISPRSDNCRTKRRDYQFAIHTRTHHWDLHESLVRLILNISQQDSHQLLNRKVGKDFALQTLADAHLAS